MFFLLRLKQWGRGNIALIATTSKTPEGRSATLKVQGSVFFSFFFCFVSIAVLKIGFLASIAARFLVTFLVTVPGLMSTIRELLMTCTDQEV